LVAAGVAAVVGWEVIDFADVLGVKLACGPMDTGVGSY
jgi:hypothetical protein